MQVYDVPPLQNTLALVSGETPTSFVSRLAAMNRAASAREFCNDFLLSFDKIARGDPTEIEKLAWLTSAPAHDLLASAPQYVRMGIFRLAEENISRKIATRHTMRICPRCALTDIQSKPDLFPDAAVAQRAIWLVGSIRTCQEHACSLVTISRTGHSSTAPDFALRSAEAMEDIEQVLNESFEREFSPFEGYLANRIFGKPKAAIALLDPLDITSVDLICSWLGRFVLLGPDASRAGASDQDLYLASQAGFEILASGALGIRNMIQAAHDKADFGGCLRPSDDRLLGRTYQFLNTETRSRPQFGEIRRIVAEKVSELYPPAAGSDRILGVSVDRKLHTLRGAAATYGLTQKTIKAYALKAGIALTMQKHGKAVCYAITAHGGDELFGPGTVMDPATVERHTGFGRSQLESLHDAGVLSPIGGEFKKGHTAFFRRNDIQRLTADIRRRLQRLDSFSVQMDTIGEAALRTSWSVGSILAFVLNEKIAVSSTDGTASYFSLRVNITELRAIAPKSVGLGTREASRLMRTSEPVLVNLGKIGLIDTHDERRQDTGRWRRTYSSESIAEFIRNYISHANISTESGLSVSTVARILKRIGVKPAFDPEKLGCAMYERASVRDLLSN